MAGHDREGRIKLYREAFDTADRCAAAGDAAGVLRAILHGPVLDGLAYRLSQHWTARKLFALKPDDTDLIVVESLKELYEKLDRADRPRNVGAYLYKTCIHKGYAIHMKRRWDPSVDPAELEKFYGQLDQRITDFDIMDPDQRKLLHIKVIRRTLLPRIGQKNVQDVMDFIFDALERNVQVTTQEIADHFGVSEAHVRTWKSRGFTRLLERIREAGLFDGDGLVDLTELEEQVQEETADERPSQ
jgi:hypothetical protein